MHTKIIAVDFDGTLCENKWPGIGGPRVDVIRHVLAEQKHGAKLILWTCRVGELLEDAVAWCKKFGLEFDAVNENLPELVGQFGNDTRKVFATEYLDDRAVFPPDTASLQDFLTLKYSLDGGAIAPRHSHDLDAGYDLSTPIPFSLGPGELNAVHTGVHIQIPKGYFGKIEGKSGLAVKYGVVPVGGVIDAGYSGEIVVMLHNLSDVAYDFLRGDRVAQIIFHRIATPPYMMEVEEVSGGERGVNGFGSTGR